MAIVKGVKQEMEVVWFKVHPLYDELGVVARFSLTWKMNSSARLTSVAVDGSVSSSVDVEE